MRIGSFVYPAVPALDEGEATLAVFAGLRARVTLTETRIILSHWGHTSIAYDDVICVDGGYYAGPGGLRDNAMIVGGIYLKTLDQHEEWVHIPDAKRAADLIKERAANLEPNDVPTEVWAARVKAAREAGQA